MQLFVVQSALEINEKKTNSALHIIHTKVFQKMDVLFYDALSNFFVILSGKSDISISFFSPRGFFIKPLEKV